MALSIEITEQFIWEILNKIPDPEVPAISIVDLGVVRAVRVENEKVFIDITPTYTGCPALKLMEENIREALNEIGVEVEIKLIYKPAWTTEWMSEATKQKLKEYGIAPPEKITFEHLHPFGNTNKEKVKCPFCNSENTSLTSQFGSTACKALYFCDGCHQPFEHFKCH